MRWAALFLLAGCNVDARVAGESWDMAPDSGDGGAATIESSTSAPARESGPSADAGVEASGDDAASYDDGPQLPCGCGWEGTGSAQQVPCSYNGNTGLVAMCWGSCSCNTPPWNPGRCHPTQGLPSSPSGETYFCVW